MSKFRETYNKLLGHGQESIKKGSDLYDFCMAMLNDESIKSMGGADFDEKVKTYMQKLGIAGAGPVPNTLLARQDLEAGKKKSMAVQKSKVEKKPTSQKGYKEDLGQLKQYHHDEALRMVRTMARSGASPEKIRADVGYGFGMQSWDVNDLMREAGILKSQVEKDAALDRARDYYDHGKSLEELADEYSERFSISYQTAFRLMSQVRTETKKQITPMEKSAQSDAQAIMSLDDRIWNEMGIRSGSQLNKPELWEKYKNRVSQSVTGRVKRDVWEILEDNNHNSLVFALRELGRLDMAKSQVEKSIPNDTTLLRLIQMGREDRAIEMLESAGLTTSDAQAKVEALERTHKGQVKKGQTIECHPCAGTGVEDNGDTCEVCGGTGQLPVGHPKGMKKSQVEKESYGSDPASQGMRAARIENSARNIIMQMVKAGHSKAEIKQQIKNDFGSDFVGLVDNYVKSQVEKARTQVEIGEAVSVPHHPGIKGKVVSFRNDVVYIEYKADSGIIRTEGFYIEEVKKGQVEQTGKQLERLADKAAEAEGTDEEKSLVDRIKAVQIKRQQATINARSKNATAKSFKDFWQQTQNHE